MTPKIGLALGSGGSRGFAHLGVLKALKEHNIPIDMIAGSSMGALVGCFYAMGHDMDKLIKLSVAFRRNDYLDFTVPRRGFIEGKRIQELVELFTQGKKLEQLSIPVCVIATDLQTGEKVEFREGNIAQAIRASIAIPGIFTPVNMSGRTLVDGGVVDKVPISSVRKMGADIVIGSDVSMINKKAQISTVYDVIMQSIDILQTEIGIIREKEADIMIRPKVEQYNSRSFKNIKEIIEEGEKATVEKIKEIRRKIESFSANKDNNL